MLFLPIFNTAIQTYKDMRATVVYKKHKDLDYISGSKSGSHRMKCEQKPLLQAVFFKGLLIYLVSLIVAYLVAIFLKQVFCSATLWQSNIWLNTFLKFPSVIVFVFASV